MPYRIKKETKGYKVINKKTGRVYAYHTLNPKKLIAAIEINKLKKNGVTKQ